jgi:protease-4
MDPQVMIHISGISAGRTYYKHALEKMGVGFDEWRFFKYKSAMESFSRDSLSEPDREQRQAIIDDIYETAAETITSARGISMAKFDELVNEKALLMPDEAMAAGIVDSIGTFHDAKKAAKKADLRSSIDESPTVLAGLLGDEVWGPQEWGEPPHIALIYAIGPCAMDSGIKGRTLSGYIRAARENPAVKAVVFRADSPGGDPLPSDLVSRELKETAKKKPVIVSQGWVAGSGGYWISMYGDTIVAAPVTITGSIGVIGGWFWNKELGEKIGFDYDGIKRGEHADLGAGIRLPFTGMSVPERQLTPDENDRMEHLIRMMYKDFVAQVAEGRGLTEEEVHSIGQGRVWSGKKGKEIGLVDELGGLWLSLRIAKEAAGIPADDPIVIAEGPDLGWFNPSMFTPKLFGIDLSGVRNGADALVADRNTQNFLPEEEMTFLMYLIRSKGQPLLMMEPMGLRDGSW